jgi:2-oxoisovalerate dehydrogenase E1 component
VREGSGLTVVTYGWGVHWAVELAAEMPELDIEVIDLRTLIPWDVETVVASVRKSGRCVVLHEDTLTGGFGAEIAATITEQCFSQLDAPVLRVGSLDTPVPFNRGLEDSFLAKSRLREVVRRVMEY